MTSDNINKAPDKDIILGLLNSGDWELKARLSGINPKAWMQRDGEIMDVSLEIVKQMQFSGLIGIKDISPDMKKASYKLTVNINL